MDEHVHNFKPTGEIEQHRCECGEMAYGMMVPFPVPPREPTIEELRRAIDAMKLEWGEQFHASNNLSHMGMYSARIDQCNRILALLGPKSG